MKDLVVVIHGDRDALRDGGEPEPVLTEPVTAALLAEAIDEVRQLSQVEAAVRALAGFPEPLDQSVGTAGRSVLAFASNTNTNASPPYAVTGGPLPREWRPDPHGRHRHRSITRWRGRALSCTTDGSTRRGRRR
ncbi:hypothetical protein ACFV8Z_05015 [Streptomyces sp. NPDC059837]|uniref:hypothetical protein n=1 Tax=unclassified Streptomyces TaxID=2593676 RepID=UPI00365A1D30